MKVFIAYGSAADQVTGLRLQALAAVNGLTVYVPPADTRQPNRVFLDPESSRKITDSDIVLCVVGAGLTESCRLEINAAILQNKKILPMCYPQFAQQLEPYFGPNIVVIDQTKPDLAERQIVLYLNALNAEKKQTVALLALGTLALGLLIFAPSK
jgi:hypothetical protein